jgi:hypothetical protein
MKTSLLVILIFAVNLQLFTQTNKELALQFFQSEDYPKAIELMELAKTKSPMDSEVHYYLGVFKHYLANDSRPLRNYNKDFSNEIYAHFIDALNINPNFQNAKYFFGAECSSNAFKSMYYRDMNRLAHFYEKADSIGAYPKWLKEFGRNILNSCKNNSILFVGGNADFDICMYLQIHENLRRDISIIPIGNIDRPWYIAFIKDGLSPYIRETNISLSDYQIHDLHPYKWENTEVTLPVNKMVNEVCFADSINTFPFTIEPDLTSDRLHQKFSNEQVAKRNYLSPQRAMLFQIIQDNYNNRPVFFTNFCNNTFLSGLQDYCRNHGLVKELMPIKTSNTEWETDFNSLEKLLRPKHLKDYKNILDNDIPRISSITQTYFQATIILNDYYLKHGKKQSKQNLMFTYSTCLNIGYTPDLEAYLEQLLNQ